MHFQCLQINPAVYGVSDKPHSSCSQNLLVKAMNGRFDGMLALSLKLRSKSLGNMHPFIIVHVELYAVPLHRVLDIQVPHRLGIFLPVGAHWRVYPAGGGVWGRSPTADCCQAPSVSDNDLQAQAWFPATLTSLLHLAEQAATITLDTCEHTLPPVCVPLLCFEPCWCS